MYVFIIFLFALCLIVQVKVTRYQNSLESDSATRTRTEQGFCIDYSPVDAKIAEIILVQYIVEGRICCAVTEVPRLSSLALL